MGSFEIMPCPPVIDDPDLKELTRLIRHPVFGHFYRHRFSMVLGLCPQNIHTILEIGYGAGYLAYALSPQCVDYYGIDIHSYDRQVADCLHRQQRLNVTLRYDDARSLSSIPDESVDLVVSVSCLEHIREVDDVQQAVRRVLKPGAVAAYGLPQKNLLTNLLFAMLGYDDEAIHPTSPSMVKSGAEQAGMPLLREVFFPSPLMRGFEMYWAGLFQKPALA